MQKQATLIELHCFPSIQYFSKFLCDETIILEQQENYRKGSYRNRFTIASANGPLALSIPLVKGKNQQKTIRTVQIHYADLWQKQYWTAIQSAYGKSPYFEYYADDIRPFFTEQYNYLFDYNLAVLKVCLKILRIETSIQFSSSYSRETQPDTLDLRNHISPKQHKNKADARYQLVEYPQVFQEKTGFLPNLSILDLLFCQGPEAILTLKASVLNV